jgi:hypothetical protein
MPINSPLGRNRLAGGGGYASKSKRPPASLENSRVKELKRRIEDATIHRVSSQIAFTKELILRELWENAQEAKTVKGGSAIVNRALELIGKEIGMFKEPEVKAPVNLEDLPQEALERMLAQAEAAAAEPPKEQPAIPPDAPLVQ